MNITTPSPQQVQPILYWNQRSLVRAWALVDVQLEVLVLPEKAATHFVHCVVLLVLLRQQNLWNKTPQRYRLSSTGPCSKATNTAILMWTKDTPALYWHCHPNVNEFGSSTRSHSQATDIAILMSPARVLELKCTYTHTQTHTQSLLCLVLYHGYFQHSNFHDKANSVTEVPRARSADAEVLGNMYALVILPGRKYIRLWGNGCTPNLLTQHWENLRVLLWSRGTLTNKCFLLIPACTAMLTGFLHGISVCLLLEKCMSTISSGSLVRLKVSTWQP